MGCCLCLQLTTLNTVLADLRVITPYIFSALPNSSLTTSSLDTKTRLRYFESEAAFFFFLATLFKWTSWAEKQNALFSERWRRAVSFSVNVFAGFFWAVRLLYVYIDLENTHALENHTSRYFDLPRYFIYWRFSYCWWFASVSLRNVNFFSLYISCPSFSSETENESIRKHTWRYFHTKKCLYN